VSALSGMQGAWLWRPLSGLSQGVRHVALIQHPTNSGQIVCMHHEWAFFGELIQMPIHMMRCNTRDTGGIDGYVYVLI
jgi:hypothetical protein